MKKFLYVVLAVMVLAAFVVPAAFAQEQEPPKIEQFNFLAQLLVGIVTAAVTFGLKAVAQEWGIDLTGKSTQFTAAIVLALFEFINGLIALVPPAWYGVVVSGLGFVTALLTASGVALVLKGKHTKFALPKLK